MHLLIIGTGYVGLVTGACFAEMGHHVMCLDIDTAKIAMLRKGIIPIYEPHLEELVKKNSEAGRLTFTTDYNQALAFSSICILALPSPAKADGSADLSYVNAAAEKIAEIMTDYKLIINKSTLPVGSAHLIKSIIQEILDRRRLKIEFDIAVNPEFLKEGDAVNDCMKPDRIILGVENSRVESTLRQLYTPFSLNTDRIFIMDILSAELTKYAANAMLATRISFMNEMALLCEKIGANIHNVRKGVGADKRIGSAFLYAGIGYGGSCFPKDIQALRMFIKERECSCYMLDAVETVNTKQKRYLAEKIQSYFQSRGGIENKTIAIWGLSFKPDTDDMREAPSLILIEQLLQAGAHLRLYDPVAINNAKKIIGEHGQITWCDNEENSAVGAHAIALVTEWKQFRSIDFAPIITQMQGKAFFDGRNQYNGQEMAKIGFDYIGIGVASLIQT